MDRLLPDLSQQGRMSPLLQGFLRDETAATSIEYGLIAIMVSVAIIVALQFFAQALSDLWTHTASTVTSNI